MRSPSVKAQYSARCIRTFQYAQRGLVGKILNAQERRASSLRRGAADAGGAVESVLGSAIEEEDIPKLIGFLKRQEANGKFFSKAMQKEPVANTEEV